ncbi:hypothetical protein NLX83_30100 [Allokutzneria sp. A3M-2-11 16]|uniref:hypothetical protein n=1 Tax=Allokutzneria sp. A3M-2-11 16 TaxID=2962043 RepID=UPI0020B7C148|nr:hypothetical protein [Allokutzneria sp. A3M-2-11 16]MCP3803532.1 hypothetical protein [Allokutzneria sp. A3M-2-11 16]
MVIKTRPAVTAAGCVLGLILGASTATAQPQQYTADQVRSFLVGFYGKHGPSQHDREHRVTPELKKKAAETPDYDLLLCAQNEPRRIGIGRVTTAQSAGVGWATVTTRWSGPSQRFTAYVGLDASQPMKLYDIECKAER